MARVVRRAWVPVLYDEPGRYHNETDVISGTSYLRGHNEWSKNGFLRPRATKLPFTKHIKHSLIFYVKVKCERFCEKNHAYMPQKVLMLSDGRWVKARS